MTTCDSTWGDPNTAPACPWPSPERDNAPVCFVERQPGDLRIAHAVVPATPEELAGEARELLAIFLRRYAAQMNEPIGEGRTYVLRDAYCPGWHIVCAEAPRVPSWTAS